MLLDSWTLVDRNRTRLIKPTALGPALKSTICKKTLTARKRPISINDVVSVGLSQKGVSSVGNGENGGICMQLPRKIVPIC